MMIINSKYYIVATILIITLLFNITVNGGYVEQFKPMQLHLALTDKHDEMKVNWLTKSALPQPTVYYYSVSSSSQCDRESAIIPSDILKRLSIAIGSTTTYEKFDGYIHSVVLKNLKSAKTYCYLVGGEVKKTESNKTASTVESYTPASSVNVIETSWAAKWSHFTTKSEFLADKVTFVALADAGTRGDVFHVIDAMRKDPSFSMVIHAGDLSYAQTDDVWDLFGDIIEPVSATRPYMVIPGNWDIKPFAAQAFVSRYQMPLVYPTPEIVLEQKADGTGSLEPKTFYNYYYSINYTHTYIIMMSSYDPYNKDTKQYNWLESELIKANKQRHLTPWIVVCAHSPMYSSSQGHGGSDMAFRGEIEKLLAKYKVNLVLSGHDHGYERTYPVFNDKVLRNEKHYYSSQDGTVHVLAGTAGADSDPWLERPDWTVVREATTGYTKVIAGRGSLEVIYQRYNGTKGDRFIIVKDSRPSTITTSDDNNSSSTSYLIFFLLCLVFIFPFCAYNRIPHKIFSFLSGQTR